MKKIKFTCSHCQAKLRVPTHLAGVTAPCPKCGAKITAPSDFENFIEEEPVVATRSPAAQASVEKVVAQSTSPAHSGQSIAALPKPDPVPVPPQPVPARVAPVPIPPAVSASDPNDVPGEIIVESKSSTAPAMDDAPNRTPVELPDPVVPQEEPAQVEHTQSIPIPSEPIPPQSVENELPPQPVPIPSVPPSSLDEDIVAPELEEPPAVAKTQPIKINPRPSSLPPIRESDSAAPGELPRLDTSLAGSGGEAAETLTSEESTETTKVMLPMPGQSINQFTPGDFIVPSSSMEEELADVAAEMSEPIANLSVPEVEATQPEEVMVEEPEPPSIEPISEEDELDEFAVSIDEISLGGDDEPSVSMDDIEFSGPIRPAPLVEEALEQLPEALMEEDSPSTEIQSFSLGPAPEKPKKLDLSSDLGLELAPTESDEEKIDVADEPAISREAAAQDISTEHDEESAGPGDEETENGSDELDEFLSGMDVPGHRGPESRGRLDLEDVQVKQPEEKGSILDIFSEGEEEKAPGGSLSEGSIETLLSEQASPEAKGEKKRPRKLALPKRKPKPEAVADPETDFVSDVDVSAPTEEIDELFDSSIPTKKGEGPSRTTVVMLSAIGAVAIISIVVVILAVNALGGFQVAQPEPDIEPPPPAIANGPESLATGGPAMSPGMDSPSGDAPSSLNPGGTAAEDLSVNRGVPEPPGMSSNDAGSGAGEATEIGNSAFSTDGEASASDGNDAPAMSFDERVLSIVNGSAGTDPVEGAGSGITGLSEPGELSTADMANAAASQFVSAVGDNAPGVNPLASVPDDQVIIPAGAGEALSGLGEPLNELGNAANEMKAAAGEVLNYNPEDSFAVPSSTDAPLGRTHDLLDAYLRAPDWESRMKYIYQGQSLRPAVEQYYQKWPFTRMDQFAKTLFQMEPNAELGGPYWVYLISENDDDTGFPMIIREENGLLKVDWEIYTEFKDRHFIKFLEGDIPSPHTLRVVMNRVSDYYGPDRDGFTNLDQYYVYQVNPPYGGLNEFSTYAFVDKASPIAERFEEVIGLNEEALAVIVTIEERPFPHGINHFVVTDYVTEGWFR